MQKLTRIYCGRNRKNGTLVRINDIYNFLRAEVATQYESFTITHATRYWNGQQEETFVIEVITQPVSHHVDFRPKQIANAYKQQFDQEAVLVTVQSVESTVV